MSDVNIRTSYPQCQTSTLGHPIQQHQTSTLRHLTQQHQDAISNVDSGEPCIYKEMMLSRAPTTLHYKNITISSKLTFYCNTAFRALTRKA